MRSMYLAATVLAAASLSAASLPATQLHGSYVESRTADVYTGPCFANAETGVTGDLAVMGWKIDSGTYQGVALDGLSVMGAVHASGTLGDPNENVYPAKAVLIIDERANPEQRLALMHFAQRMGGQLLADVVRVEYQPIGFALAGNSVHSMTATMQAGALARLETRPLGDKDQICHNEATWYPPLTPTDHAMPAYTIAQKFAGPGLGEVWSSPGKRSAFVASFHLAE
ncbi:MAG TPA: DUF1326 domain-containing protein [Bryobacteraceae bacterium]|nr:DUF1326 domain-containing protein [Bryobacteraceae bacterium]